MKLIGGMGLVLGGAILGMGTLYAIEIMKSRSVYDMVEDMKCSMNNMN